MKKVLNKSSFQREEASTTAWCQSMIQVLEGRTDTGSFSNGNKRAAAAGKTREEN